MHDFRSNAGLARTPHDPVGRAAEVIGQRRISERELIVQKRMYGLIHLVNFQELTFNPEMPSRLTPDLKMKIRI